MAALFVCPSNLTPLYSCVRDAAINKLMASGNMALLLAAEVFDIVNESGATQLDVICAFDIVKSLVTSSSQTERSEKFEKFFRFTDS
jgi:hypothetical protein